MEREYDKKVKGCVDNIMSVIEDSTTFKETVLIIIGFNQIAYNTVKTGFFRFALSKDLI